MPDKMTVAFGRARELVGESVWIKLSRPTQINAILEELRALDDEYGVAAKAFQPPDDRGFGHESTRPRSGTVHAPGRA